MSTKIEDLIDTEEDYFSENGEMDNLIYQDQDQDQEYEQEQKQDVVIGKEIVMKTITNFLDTVYQKVKHPLVIFILIIFFTNPNISKVFEPLGYNANFINILIGFLITMFFSIIREFI